MHFQPKGHGSNLWSHQHLSPTPKIIIGNKEGLVIGFAIFSTHSEHLTSCSLLEDSLPLQKGTPCKELLNCLLALKELDSFNKIISTCFFFQLSFQTVWHNGVTNCLSQSFSRFRQNSPLAESLGNLHSTQDWTSPCSNPKYQQNSMLSAKGRISFSLLLEIFQFFLAMLSQLQLLWIMNT